MCQEWDLCTNNITHQMKRTTTFKTLKYRRRRQFLLHLLRLVGSTSAKARDTMHQHAKQNAKQTQTSGIESCQQPISQKYTWISTTAPKDDPDLYLVAHVDKDDRMRNAYIACIRICPMWSQIYNAPEGKKGVSKYNGFL